MTSYRNFIALLTCWLASLVLSHATEPSDLKYDVSVKPSMLHGSAADMTVPAVKFDSAISYNLGIDPDNDIATSFKTKGTIATDPDANSDILSAVLLFGYSHLFADWKMVATTNMTSDSPNARPVFHKVDKLGGLLDLSLKAQFETDQQFHNDNFTYGPQIGFSPTGRRGFTWLVPACYVDYQRVEVIHSDYNQQHGISDEAYWRFDASAGWRYPFGDELLTDNRWLRPLGAEFDLHYFRAFEPPAGASAGSFSDGLYYAATINYNLRALDPSETKQPWWKPYYIYVTVGHGQQLPVFKNQTSVYLGVVYSWGK